MPSSFEYLYSHIKKGDQKLYDAFQKIDQALTTFKSSAPSIISGGGGGGGPVTNFENGYRISVLAFSFGVVGDGLANDTVAMQNVINAAAGITEIFIPFGVKVLVDHLELKSGIHIFGPGEIISNNNIPLGKGLLNIDGILFPMSDILLAGDLKIDGKKFVPEIRNIGSGGNNPLDILWCKNSTIMGRGNIKGLTLDGITIQHTDGHIMALHFYHTLPDSASSSSGGMVIGNMDDINIMHCRFLNNRSSLMGGFSEYRFGTIGGGIILQSDCLGNNFTNVRVEDNDFSRCTGTCFWSHYIVGGVPPLPNINLYFANNWCEVIGLDGVQFAGWNGVDVIGNYIQVGFVAYDPTNPTDDNAAIKAAWYRTSSQSLTPVCIDSAGWNRKLRKIGNVCIANGEGISSDGDAEYVVTGNILESAFVTHPPIDLANCGPWSNVFTTYRGRNFTTAGDISNTNRLAGVGQQIIFSGNIIYGWGYNNLSIYGCQFGKFQGNYFLLPDFMEAGAIMIFGNFTGFHSTANDISGNTFEYPGTQSGIYAIVEIPFDNSEPPVSVPYSAANAQLVKDNILIGSIGSIQKDPNSSTTTGKLQLTSVTPQANGYVGADLSVVGTSNTNKGCQLYLNYNGAGSLVWSASSNAFTLNSNLGFQILGTPAVTHIDGAGNGYFSSLQIHSTSVNTLAINNNCQWVGNDIIAQGVVSGTTLSIAGAPVINNLRQLINIDTGQFGGIINANAGINAGINGVKAGGFAVTNGSATTFGIGTYATPKLIGMKAFSDGAGGWNIRFYDLSNPTAFFLYFQVIGGIITGVTN